jgi:hypothetical protein
MKYALVFLLVGLMVGCGNDATGDVKKVKAPKLKEYSMDEVTIPNDTMAFFKKDMKPVTGIVREWYKNGQLRYEFNYKNGKLNGLQRWWYENGQLGKEYNYKDSLQRKWTMEQVKTLIELYLNINEGKEDGLQRGWYENGQLEYEYNYKNGEPDVKRWWYENGQLMREWNFKDDKYWDEDGNEVDDLGGC